MNPLLTWGKRFSARPASARHAAPRRRLAIEPLEPRQVLSATIGMEFADAFPPNVGESDKINSLREQLEDVQGVQAIEQAEQLLSPLVGLGSDDGAIPFLRDPRAGRDDGQPGSMWSPLDHLFGDAGPPGPGEGAIGQGGFAAVRAHRPQPAGGPDRGMFADGPDEPQSHVYEDDNGVVVWVSFTDDDGNPKAHFYSFGRDGSFTHGTADDHSSSTGEPAEETSITIRPDGTAAQTYHWSDGQREPGDTEPLTEEEMNRLGTPDMTFSEDEANADMTFSEDEANGTVGRDIPDDFGDPGGPGGGLDEEEEAEQHQRRVAEIFGRVPDGQPAPVDTGTGPYVGWVLGRRPPEQPTHREMVGQPVPSEAPQHKPNGDRFEQVMSLIGREQDGQPTPTP